MDELIDSKLPKRVEMVAYSNDLIVCCTDSSEDKVMKRMQDSLDILGPIARSSGFNFSQAKTKAIYFFRNNPGRSLKLNDESIESVNEHKYLGVMMDKNLMLLKQQERLQRGTEVMKNISHLCVFGRTFDELVHKRQPKGPPRLRQNV